MDDRTGTTASSQVRDSRRGPVGIARARPGSGRDVVIGRRIATVTWPLFSGLGPLGALPTVPRLARTYTALVLGGWGLGGVVDDSQAVVSELAANAVHAATDEDGGPTYGGNGRLPVIWVRLMTDLARLRIEVWDTVPSAVSVPTPRRAAPDDESGRGLEIVASLSLNWGWEPVPDMGGKRTWAVLATA
jgi:hypothetical protein